jgi:microcystin-dependent protein
MSDAFLGEVRAMPYGFVPQGWAACQGQLLPLSQNVALFSLLGTAYGGDGRIDFALPALPPLQGQGGSLQYCISIQGIFPQRP